MKFHEKRVVITGGTGNIGQSLVELFARQGAHVLFTDRSEEDCADFYHVMKKNGLQTDYLAADLRQKIHCETIINTAVETMGGIDILLNNAGLKPGGNILNTTDDMWFSALDVNLNAAFFLSRTAIPQMIKAGGGAIVNTSSIWGSNPGLGHIAYCTSKGALSAFTKALAQDHAADNIRINAVCPNEVDTPVLHSNSTNSKEITEAIAFLASGESHNICGETIEVTGAKAVNW